MPFQWTCRICAEDFEIPLTEAMLTTDGTAIFTCKVCDGMREVELSFDQIKKLSAVGFGPSIHRKFDEEINRLLTEEGTTE